MESALSGFVLVFLLIFGMLTFARSTFSAQAELAKGWQAMYMREHLQYQTRLEITQTYFSDEGTTIIMIIENQGESRITDFNGWDLIVQYDDNSSSPMHHLMYIPYTSATPTQNEWTIDSLYFNSALDPEVFERTIFNPGESARLVVHLAQPIGEGQAMEIVVGLPTGGRMSTMMTRNTIPTLVTNNGLAMVSGAKVQIGTETLNTIDHDHSASDLTYVIVKDPTEGYLSLPSIFTQADIDAGRLIYTHAGTGSDSFQFSVTDGIDVIGIYTFEIAFA